MSEYHWWADPDLAPLGSMVGVVVGFSVAWLILALRGDL
jgi:hypothetical protein